VPLEEEFHWSRATIALAVSINLILYGCIGPFAAAVMEKFGIRRSVLCALTLVGAGVASTSLMQYPWQLILMWGVLVGVGTGFLASVLAAVIAARWFTARRGLVVGILSGGASKSSVSNSRASLLASAIASASVIPAASSAT
jgi:MFS family permease